MFTQQQTILRELGNGLLMRRATAEDVDALSEFNVNIHGEDEADRRGVAAWTRDLLTGPHATFQPGDFIIIEEAGTGRIVSSMCLIPQTWSYEGIEFGVGRPELVGTLPEFRGRGLIRAQFDEVHKWSVERGLIVQAITGIRYYYRQFGYEYALDLNRWHMGSRVPRLNEGEQENYLIRPAQESDIPFLMSVYEYGTGRGLIRVKWTAEHWHNNLYELSEENPHRLEYRIIERAGSRDPIGYFAQSPALGSSGVRAFHYELAPGISWLEVTPYVIRSLWESGQEFARRENRPCTTFSFLLGVQHPAYDVLGNSVVNGGQPYAWYLRVPDLVGFLNHIKPVLETRLADSIACGHSGEYLIGMYPKGVRLILENGLIKFDPWKPDHADYGNAGFPMLTFTQILFGYRSFEELKFAFPDCWWSDQNTRLLLNILFPKKSSSLYYGIV
jgi:GNAT superfamily N-acetyltransferase